MTLMMTVEIEVMKETFVVRQQIPPIVLLHFSISCSWLYGGGEGGGVAAAVVVVVMVVVIEVVMKVYVRYWVRSVQFTLANIVSRKSIVQKALQANKWSKNGHTCKRLTQVWLGKGVKFVGTQMLNFDQSLVGTNQ